ncbi:hypothetical protein Ae406Ps2_4059c [Pseudonocardia sp. Ae406_Ps2]|uniref:hypothetical protein n=1 Tax=Pseudonocardia sp. Ae406_Ps2 TaxID=1885033 RepID=UPI00094B3C33|nr:hypothetical protein [Pseudonocardia sp. Ae406_Ps2]OLL98229.1 hypothetical protein Ae331Ps2_1896 [Pseudonocardia sp. Ae331_Ps2]OLM04059.1 hypothetical protein Ae406Ps2_4059c [Pseudonocardia sp. Ae406_Ps2]OLM25607.1 hypothetical protein Ae706Ps2_4040c [Pseudonocardia sp. Ae706_Ps2]OLM34233.1 hypothetical protein Ae717Ps2_5129 [Pseudonocardia sp. Ae717_Ps2]
MPPDLTAPDPVTASRDASRPGAEAVATHGVGHVVGVSALGRGTPLAHRAGHVTGSLAMDDLFAATSHYRALANPTFMDNTLRAAGALHDTATLTSTTAPDHRLPLVATRDIADAAAHLLLDRSWSGFAETPLLGPEDLSGNDMAAVLSDVLADLLGRPVRYTQTDPELAGRAMLDHGASPGMARAMADMATAKNEGLDEGVTRTPATTTPTTYRDWCTENLRPVIAALGPARDARQETA